MSEKRLREIPESYKHENAETYWMAEWEDTGVYHWDSGKSREESFVVDTPPPTVSGSLHVGHVFSYTQTDLLARYQRMRGKNIMYPMGWDDNGLPTERRVQNKFGIRCNPHLPYDKQWSPVEAKDKNFVEVSRQNFIEACAKVTQEDETAFENLWRRLGLSIDWGCQYATIDEASLQVSQYSFLDLLNKGYIYQAESPTMWDVDYQTALAQADLEDRQKPGAYHDIRFLVDGGEEFVISTTRPELLVSCIAVVAHPDDERYQKYFQKKAITPLFEATVPILPSAHADPEKGTGVMMVCTFGDVADVEWWKGSGLPIKQSIGRDGRLLPVDFGSVPFLSRDPERAAEYYSELEGKKVNAARLKVAELLASEGSSVSREGRALVDEPKKIEHPVKYYEKGDRPIEFVTTRQWFVRILEHKEQLLAQGAKIDWHPPHMRSRYDNWVQGLQHDWCISRQRFFGVPFPVWYPLDEEGEAIFEKAIFADQEALPVDPLSTPPAGFEESQRGKPGGFIGDPDVMDTWATSSLTPQIVSGWGFDEDRHAKLSPADIRPQSHEIIRTWAFYTIAKAWMHAQQIPWRNVVVSGWILDPDRKKMSKSKGNVVTPQHLLEKYSADAVRYWAARARLGVDTAFDEKVFKNGRKLCTKLFNASRFILGHENIELDVAAIREPLDLSFILHLSEITKEATEAFERFDYAGALQQSESSFWNFCDNYLELVKVRAYSSEGTAKSSAVNTLLLALKFYSRLFAPALPFLSEEIWSWRFAHDEEPSVHRASWPETTELPDVDPKYKELLSVAAEVIAAVRFEKSAQKRSLRWPVSSLKVVGSENDEASVMLVKNDVMLAGRVPEGGFSYQSGSRSKDIRFSVDVTLSEEPPE